MRRNLTRLVASAMIACGLAAAPVSAFAAPADVVATTMTAADDIGNGGFEWTT